MATATLMYPFAEMRGTLGSKNKLYTRMLNGKCIVQRKPHKTTPKQQAMRKAFGVKYAGKHTQLPLADFTSLSSYHPVAPP